MERINFFKPVIDIVETGSQIKFLRKKCGFSVRDIQNIFGFEYPQAVYAWEQGKNIPSIDNLLVLSRLFNVPVEQLVISRNVEVEINCAADIADNLSEKNVKSCKSKLSA